MINRSQRNLSLLFGRSRLTSNRTFSSSLVQANDAQAAVSSNIQSLWEFSDAEIVKREEKANNQAEYL